MVSLGSGWDLDWIHPYDFGNGRFQFLKTGVSFVLSYRPFSITFRPCVCVCTDLQKTYKMATHAEATRENFQRDMQWGQGIQILEDLSGGETKVMRVACTVLHGILFLLSGRVRTIIDRYDVLAERNRDLRYSF